MADTPTYIQTDELTGTVLPTGAGELIRKGQWGIDNTLTGWIIQNESIQTTRSTDQTYDQKGALVSELDYDEQYSCTFDIIGNGTVPTVGDTTFQYDDHKWKVEAVSYQGSYNDKKKYSVTLFRSKNFPSQT